MRILKWTLRFGLLALTGLPLALPVAANEMQTGKEAGKKTTLSLETNLNADFMLYWFTVAGEAATSELPLQKDGKIEWEMDIAEPVFIRVGFLRKDRSAQLPAGFPLYIQPGKAVKLQLQFDEKYRPSYVKGSADQTNKVLMAYANWYSHQQYAFWKNPPAADSVQFRCREQLQYAEALIRKHKLPDMVNRYLRLWGYTNYLDALNSHGKRNAVWSTEPGKGDYHITEKIWEETDDAMSRWFPNMRYHILQLLNDGNRSRRGRPATSLRSLCQKIEKKLHQPSWKNSLLETVLLNYVQHEYNPETVSEESKQDFMALLRQYATPEKLDDMIAQFNARSFSVVGAAIPAITFRDAEGKEVSLGQFKGKMVYIDLWASWCVPCIQEIPHLKEREKEFEGKNIVFVSISLDEKKDAWKKKMAELNLHGIQWELGNSGYDKMMNVTGIPRFILYSADGKLISGNAPRPGSPELKTLLERNLK